jgi:beta-lactamase superfamily II metal-dependent hydrolase
MKRKILTIFITMLISTNVLAGGGVGKSNSVPVSMDNATKNVTVQAPSSKNLIIESVRVGYNNDVTVIATPNGKKVGIINNIRSSEKDSIKKYMDSTGIDKLDSLVILSIDEMDFPNVEFLIKELKFDKLYTNISYSKYPSSNTERCKEILNYFKDKIELFEHNKNILLEDGLTIEVISKKHKSYYDNSDYYEEFLCVYGTIIDYKENEVLLFNNRPRSQEFNEAVKSEKKLDSDLVIFSANERISIFDKYVNLLDEKLMKTITPNNVLVIYSPANFKGYDTNTNTTLNELTDIIKNSKAAPYYSYKFNSKTTIVCNGDEDGISIKQEQIPKTVMK